MIDNKNKMAKQKNLERTRAEVQGLVTGFAVGCTVAGFLALFLLLLELPVGIAILMVVSLMFLANLLAMRMSAIDRSDRDLQ